MIMYGLLHFIFILDVRWLVLSVVLVLLCCVLFSVLVLIIVVQ